MNIIIWSIFIILFILICLNPRRGLYLMALSLPIIGIDIYFHNLILPLLDLIALLTLVGFFINYLYRRAFTSDVMDPIKWPLIVSFGLFFLANLLSIIFADNRFSTFYYFLRWPFFLYFAYIFIPANIIKTPKILKKTVIFVFIGTILVLISGYLSLLEQNIQNSFFRFKSLPILNTYPFGENHNLIAEFLNVGVFFILIIKEFIHKKRGRRLIDIVFILTTVGIILTFSRAAWITLIVQLLIYTIYRVKYQPQEKKSLITLMVFCMLILSPLIWKMGVLQSGNTGSTDSRVLLTEISIKSWREKPIFGHGSGEFINIIDRDIRFKANHGEPMDSHGFIQKILAENGLLGLATWLGMLVYLSRFTFLVIKKYYPKVKWVLPFALAAFGGIFFQFFNTSYYKGRVWFPLILFLIAIEISEKKSNKYVKTNQNTADNT